MSTDSDGAGRGLHVDLTGSRLGEGWLSCDVYGDWPKDEWPDERLRKACARHYGVCRDMVEVFDVY